MGKHRKTSLARFFSLYHLSVSFIEANSTGYHLMLKRVKSLN